GATQTWTVTGGTSSHPANYHFAIDDLNITRNGSPFRDDTFNDGNPPPAGPNFPNPPGYGVSVGTFTETGGRAIMDSAHAGVTFGVGTPDPFVGQFATLLTDISND